MFFLISGNELKQALKKFKQGLVSPDEQGCFPRLLNEILKVQIMIFIKPAFGFCESNLKKKKSWSPHMLKYKWVLSDLLPKFN